MGKIKLQSQWELDPKSRAVSHLTMELRWPLLKNKFSELIVRNCIADALILDIGAGDGKLYFQIQKICRRYIAIEPSLRMIQKFKNLSDNFICRACGEQIPFKDGIFDAVIISSVLDHSFDPIAMIKEAYRVLKPAGKVFFLLTNEDAWYKKLLRGLAVSRHRLNLEHHFHIGCAELEDYLCRENFKFINSYHFGFLRLPIFLDYILFKIIPRKTLKSLINATDITLEKILRNYGGNFVCLAVK